MIYELWDIETNNLVGDYESQDAALHVIRNAIATHGRDAVRRLALTTEDDLGETLPVAHGESLIQLALRDNPLARPA
jgi:hypothetical protein